MTKNPFTPSLISMITQAGMGILIDRLGGSVVISQADRDALAAKYGGAVAIDLKAVPGAPETYRLTLVRSDPKLKTSDDPVS